MAWIYIVHLQCRIIRFNPDYPLHPRRGWLPTPVFLPGQFHGQRDLLGYSLWGCKESDSTGRLALWFSISFSIWPLLFSCSVVSNSLRPHALQHDRLSCPPPTPGACSNLCPLSWWCHPTILSSVVPFSCPQSFPALGSFPISCLFASGGQSTGASAQHQFL